MKFEKLMANKKFLVGLIIGAVLLLIILITLMIDNNDKNEENNGVPEDWYAKDVEEEARKYAEKYPAITKLPIVYAKYLNGYADYMEFRIDGGAFEECKTDFCLKITDETNNSREKSYEILREKGINPDDYEIIYKVVTR